MKNDRVIRSEGAVFLFPVLQLQFVKSRFFVIAYCCFIFSRMGVIMSKVGLLPGSSFMQMRINLAMWGLEPGGIDTLSPSRAIWKPEKKRLVKQMIVFCGPLRAQTLSPASIGDSSAKGTCRVASSHKRTAKLHISAALTLISFPFFWRAVSFISSTLLLGIFRQNRKTKFSYLLGLSTEGYSNDPCPGRRTWRQPC